MSKRGASLLVRYNVRQQPRRLRCFRDARSLQGQIALRDLEVHRCSLRYCAQVFGCPAPMEKG